MLYCHKHCYIAKGTWAIVIEICSFMLMVIVFTWHVRSLALAAHHVKHSLSLPHRCCVHYISLWLPCCCLYITIPIPSCCARIIVLLNCCTYYDAHISNVRQVFSVSLQSFLQYLVYFGIILISKSYVAFSTIISRFYRAWRWDSCVGYHNIIYTLFLARTIQ